MQWNLSRFYQPLLLFKMFLGTSTKKERGCLLSIFVFTKVPSWCEKKSTDGWARISIGHFAGLVATCSELYGRTFFKNTIEDGGSAAPVHHLHCLHCLHCLRCLLFSLFKLFTLFTLFTLFSLFTLFTLLTPLALFTLFTLFREGFCYQIGWIFGKVPKGGGSFSIQKFMWQILGTLNRAFWSWNWYKLVISGLRVCFFNNCNCIEENQNKSHFEEGSSSHTSLRDGSGYQIGWIFGKVPNGSWPPPLRMVPISGNLVHAYHTIWPSYLLAYMQPYLS